jgi:hypothetical protein
MLFRRRPRTAARVCVLFDFVRPADEDRSTKALRSNIRSPMRLAPNAITCQIGGSCRAQLVRIASGPAA